MKIFKSFFISTLFVQTLFSNPASLYTTLDPLSVSQHFAFYELYPQTKEGKKALRHAWDLLSQGKSDLDPAIVLPQADVLPIISLVNRSTSEQTPTLNNEQLIVIESLAKNLHNRSVKGFGLWKEEEILQLKPEEIDFARALLVAELGEDEKLKIRSYEASLDLMALQISARLGENATDKEKIRAISDYIFHEMRFRFPPHSLHAKDIDLYTFLPSVLDSRKGVCLGVSILMLSLAQRLDLKLEPVTPPGHIFVRYIDENGQITNIETTARGIDLPSEVFLGVETRSLQTRNLKQVIGLAFMNQAAVCWQKQDAQTAVKLYEKARPYMEDDYLLNMFLGFNYLFIGKIEEGKQLLQKIQGVIPDHAIAMDTISDDFLKGKTSIEGIQAVYAKVDETRDSIIEKRKHLEEIVSQYPEFRQGILHIAITYLQLGREKQALPYLEKYHNLYPQDATVNYYLSAIYYQRHNFNLSWKYFLQAEEIANKANHDPKALKELKMALTRMCPKPKKV